MKLEITNEPTRPNGYQGEASISPEDYAAVGHSELCEAIAARVDAADSADQIHLTGYNDEQEVLYFTVQ